MEIAEVKVSYSSKVKAKDRVVVKTSADAYNSLREMYNDDEIDYIESSYILLLNRANQIIGKRLLSTGGRSACIIDAAVIGQISLSTNAHAIILSHNHPSGNRSASDQDVQITSKVKEALDLFDIKVLDHIIVTSDNGYTSMADEGLM
jgi:DNA repair protein RadC